MSTSTVIRAADTSTPINELLAGRWSPRSFDPAADIDEAKLARALEAARWSPSASNSQPWRFIVARRGEPAFDTVAATLVGFNTAWAGSASALVVAIAAVIDDDGKPRPWANYDLGQAVAHFSIQAHSDGLHVHQMGGFSVDELRGAFELPDELVPVSVVAVGVLGAPDSLPEKLLAREVAPRERRPIEESLIAV